MIYKVLVLDSNDKERKKFIKELSARKMNAIGVCSFEKAKELLENDGLIHVVLSEHEVLLKEGGQKKIKAFDLFKKINEIRFEVGLYLLSNETRVEKLMGEGLLNGYFYKSDNDFDDIVHKVHAEVINSKKRAPFYEALVEYSQKAKDSWHTPGHSSGYSVRNSEFAKDFYEFFGDNLFACDVSVSVPGLDSLMHPTGVIQEAQELAAMAFNSRYTFFSTNGTSTSNKILLQTLLKPGDAILLDRNCHKSVHYGVVISGAEPLYLMPSVNNKYGIFGPIPKKRIIDEMDQAIAAGKKLKAVILTNCTYDGLIYDIKDIINEVHKRGVKIIVDEAWFGYANFHKEFYPSAMAAGADYSTQSTHKTMSAFSQASMIHVKDPEFEEFEDVFNENFCMHTSTSPQYPMIASLDVARKQMVMEGYSLLQKALEMSDSLRKSINSLKKFSVLEKEDLISDEIRNDNIRLDRLKITIDISKSGYSSKEIEHLLLTKHNIQIEKSTFNTISILITIGSTFSKINRLYLALENIEKMSGTKQTNATTVMQNDFDISLSPIKYRPRFAFYCDGMAVNLRDAENKIATRMITPYPPGIPVLVPGQLITKEIVKALQTYNEYGVEIHGLHDNQVMVMTEEEEKTLQTDGFMINNG